MAGILFQFCRADLRGVKSISVSGICYLFLNSINIPPNACCNSSTLLYLFMNPGHGPFAQKAAKELLLCHCRIPQFTSLSRAMKAGRPAYHVPSKWVTATTPEGIFYYELDKKGVLISTKMQPARVVPVDQPAQPPVAASPQPVHTAPVAPRPPPPPPEPAIDSMDMAFDDSEFFFADPFQSYAFE
jgi:hypothetical protein